MNIAKHQKIGARCAVSSRVLAGLVATIILSGCSLTNTRIDARDERVSLPAFRMGMNFNDGKQATAEPQSGHAIEIGVTKASGSDYQSLATGQNPITFGSTTFTAPDQLQNDFELDFGDISWRMRKFFDDRALGIEVSAGIGYSSLGMTLSSPTQTASDQLFSRGPQAGFGLIWRFDQSSSVQARIGGFVSPDDHGINRMTRYDLSYSKAFLDNFSLRLGYAVWEAYGQTMNYGSDFKLHFSGPVVALNWDFSASNRKIIVTKAE